MLYLSRKVGQSIVINEEIEIIVSEIRGGRAKIGIQSPESYVIWRKEILDSKNQNGTRGPSTLHDHSICARKGTTSLHLAEDA
ncbi:MAG: carbon storage regulator [Holosporales bacterium]|jgi:carbon storage regulator|nr:carbon storage regulator [Holosporales bacterium]